MNRPERRSNWDRDTVSQVSSCFDMKRSWQGLGGGTIHTVRVILDYYLCTIQGKNL